MSNQNKNNDLFVDEEIQELDVDDLDIESELEVNEINLEDELESLDIDDELNIDLELEELSMEDIVLDDIKEEKDEMKKEEVKNEENVTNVEENLERNDEVDLKVEDNLKIDTNSEKEEDEPQKTKTNLKDFKLDEKTQSIIKTSLIMVSLFILLLLSLMIFNNFKNKSVIKNTALQNKKTEVVNNFKETDRGNAEQLDTIENELDLNNNLNDLVVTINREINELNMVTQDELNLLEKFEAGDMNRIVLINKIKNNLTKKQKIKIRIQSLYPLIAEKELDSFYNLALDRVDNQLSFSNGLIEKENLRGNLNSYINKHIEIDNKLSKEEHDALLNYLEINKVNYKIEKNKVYIE